jgi:transcriptional regulator with XRE-family HTH domain
MKLNHEKVQILMAEQIIDTNELASKSELSRVFIGSCIKGNANPKPATIGKIARALNVPVTDIIENGAATPDETTNK